MNEWMQGCAQRGGSMARATAPLSSSAEVTPSHLNLPHSIWLTLPHSCHEKKKKKGTSFACCFFSVAKSPICIINTCIDLLWHHNHYICYAKIVLWQSKTVFKVNGCLPLHRVFLLFPQSGRNYGWFQNTWSHDSKSVFVKIQGWVSLPTGSTFPTLPYFHWRWGRSRLRERERAHSIKTSQLKSEIITECASFSFIV